MLNAIIGKIKVWWAHHRDAGAGQYPFHCYYCNITLRAPEDEVLEYVSAHLRHPSHRTAEAQKVYPLRAYYTPSATDVVVSDGPESIIHEWYSSLPSRLASPSPSDPDGFPRFRDSEGGPTVWVDPEAEETYLESPDGEIIHLRDYRSRQ